MKLTGLFFFLIFLSGCNPASREEEVAIIWKDDQAIGLSVPGLLIQDANQNNLENEIFIRLAGDSLATGIFGNFSAKNDHIVFNPLIPFSRGLRYHVFFRGEQIATVEIPGVPSSDFPTVLNVFPSGDTLPENQLKLYITFSKPMKEGEALRHVLLISSKQDTVAAPFLEVKPELWNEAGTTLTLWFDPGRIKRDLLPNAGLGAPLKKGERYTLTISDQWKDQRGANLQSGFIKSFVVTERDSVLPNPDAWHIRAPRSGTKDPLRVALNEPLDYLLIKSAIQVTGKNEKEIPGIINVVNNETELVFIPEMVWNKGNHYLHIENRLEDLAGNNLERPFDRDLMMNPPGEKIPKGYTVKFSIE